jgi:hypothetical protein|mmetsp:Transcript_9401/g.1395  ORF Transcript_9401/g.1395 Transcript_9401/m.1395 type:complete len:87 (+) Transcript_9401:382-642(+)
MKINEMEDIMDDMEELMIDTEEMNEIMSRNYGVEIDEGELEDELAALDDEILDDYMGNNQINAPSYLPQPQQRQENEMLDFPSPPS